MVELAKVGLDELDRILHARRGDEVASLLSRVPADDFYAIDCAIIHRNYRPGTAKDTIAHFPTKSQKN